MSTDFLTNFLRDKGNGYKRPQAPSVTEMSVKRKLRASLNESSVVFSGSELQILARLIEKAEFDPFQGDPFLTKDDLAKLGMTVIDKGTPLADKEDRSLGDAFGGEGGGGEEDGVSETEPIPVSAALTAPDNTPGASEPIPPEVIASMDVLKGNSGGSENVADPDAIRSRIQGGGGVGEPDFRQQAKRSLEDIFQPEEKEVKEVSDNDILAAFESKGAEEISAAAALKILRENRKSDKEKKDSLASAAAAYRRKSFMESETIGESVKQRLMSSLDALGGSAE